MVGHEIPLRSRCELAELWLPGGGEKMMDDGLWMMGEKGDDAACVGHADGWGVRACAAALTVGKDLLVTFPSLEK